MENPVRLESYGEGLEIEWSDGVMHRLAWRDLRFACPCATCRVKRESPTQPSPPVINSGSRGLTILTAAEAQPIRATKLRPVGNYAYAIEFNDGHNTGIYPLEALRELGMAGTV
jgi:DUF971 family protein